jgi:hypothetical protein
MTTGMCLPLMLSAMSRMSLSLPRGLRFRPWTVCSLLDIEETSTCKTMWHHGQEDHIARFHCCENLKFHIFL